MALRDASREVRLQWFARQVLDASFEGLDVDGASIQEWAKQAGLVDEHVVTAADLADDSALRGIANFECLSEGDTYYSFSDDLKAENARWAEMASDKGLS